MEPREFADGVWVFTSRAMCTTTTVVAGRRTAAGRSVLLVDPAWEPDELVGIADWLDRNGMVVGAGWATHAHYDHVLWHPRFGAAPRWATTAAATYASGHCASLVAGLGPDWRRDLAPLVGAVTGWDGDEVPWDGPLVRVVRHSAHCPGHSALWVERAEVLIAGDMLSDIEIPLPDSEGISGYLRGLRLLEPWVRRARVLVPGHGRVAVRGEADSPESRLALDLAYLSDPARATGDPRLRNAPGWLLDQHERNTSWIR